MIIGVDKAQQAGKHDLKHSDLEKLGHELIHIPIPVGDYIEITPKLAEVIKRRGDKLKKMDLIGDIDVSVDTKKDCNELYQDLIQDHARFSDSCFLAQNNNIQLYILVENKDGVTSLDTIGRWKNEISWKRYFGAKKRAEKAGKKAPRPPVSPTQLMKIMWTMQEKYGVKFLFCTPEETGSKIAELLLRYRGESAK